MAEATFTFPEGFLWGTATAAHQVEGQNKNNNWYAWELAGRIQNDDQAGLACDWWGGRWREDFDRAAEAGQNAHRLSIEWSRVQPGPDRWDEDALDQYREMVRGLVDRGMKPLVTLHHFSDPLWIYEDGGWETDRSEAFAVYVRRVVEALREYVQLWCTINEPNVYATLGYLLGDFPPGKKNLIAALRVMTNLMRGHAAAYHTIHEIQSKARVGLSINYRDILPARSWHPLDRWVARQQSQSYNDFFPYAAASGVLRYPLGRKRIANLKGTQDYLGLNYYTREYARFSLFSAGELFGRRFYREDALFGDTGFTAIEPLGFGSALRWAKGYGLPILVTENGIEDKKDRVRPRFLAEHIRQLWRALSFNWQIEGYFYWSLVDNFEWERGWSQRYGLWELDVETQARRKRPSADFYAEICKENALSSQMVARYAPEIFSEMFPNE